MRPVDGCNRRFFLTRLLAGFWTFCPDLGRRAGPRRARAEDRDYFTGTEFVGKNRVGPHKNFYINYWKPMRRIAPSKYGYKNPKAIVRIEYVDAVQYGTWSKIGPYSPDGTILPGTDHPLDRGKRPHRIPGGKIKSY